MSEDLRHAAVIEHGIRAEHILKDAVYLESWEQVEAALVEKWKGSPARDSEGREYLFLMLKALRDARAALEQAMQNGKYALHLREEESRLAKLNPFRRKA